VVTLRWKPDLGLDKMIDCPKLGWFSLYRFTVFAVWLVSSLSIAIWNTPSQHPLFTRPIPAPYALVGSHVRLASPFLLVHVLSNQPRFLQFVPQAPEAQQRHINAGYGFIQVRITTTATIPMSESSQNYWHTNPPQSDRLYPFFLGYV
jgi:hypothetical protein